MTAFTFFATAAKGTEGAVRDELREHRFRGVKATRGGVHFGGELFDAFRACLVLRCAVRILWELGTFDADGAPQLYAGVTDIDWTDILTPRHTLAVRATCRDSKLTHTQFIAQKTKDAICDQMRERHGERPNVDPSDPDVLVTVHLVKDRATVLLDVGGTPLHRRGYRVPGATAPLKETLAACIVRLSGWDRERPFMDPMCGSGTLAIEAASWAAGIAPGLNHNRFGLERWAMHTESDARRFAELRSELAAVKAESLPAVWASDVDPACVAATRRSARAAGARVRTLTKSIEALRRPEHTDPTDVLQVVTNPPYGERLTADRALYAELGRLIRRLGPCHASVLAGSPQLGTAMKLWSTSRLELNNGPIRCSLLRYEVGGQSG